MMSVRQYAAHRKRRKLPGGTLQAVQAAIESGRITRGPGGRINPEEADGQWIENTDADRAPGGTSAAAESGSREGPSLIRQKAIREAYRARRERISYEREVGELVAVADVRSKYFEIGRKVRERLEVIPDRVAAQLAGETKADAIHAVLREEIRGALEELTR